MAILRYTKKFDYSHSGGQGLHKRGNEIICYLIFLKLMTAAILASYRVILLFGLPRGEPGTVGKNYVIIKEGKSE